MITIKRLGLILVLLLFSSTVTFAGSTAHYTYQENNEETFDYWFSSEGLRIESKKPGSKTLIYRSKDDELITLAPESREAVILDREQIKQLIRKIKQIQQRLESLPPKQRRMMKQAMGGMTGKIKDAEEIDRPEFELIESTTWRDHPAQRGVLRTGGDTLGTALLLDDPPIAIEDDERKAFENFKDFFVEILRLSGSVSESLDVTETLNQSRSLLGEMQFRLAEFQSSTSSLKLTDWSRESVADDFFGVPDDYSIRRPSFQGNAMGSPSGSPQQ